MNMFTFLGVGILTAMLASGGCAHGPAAASAPAASATPTGGGEARAQAAQGSSLYLQYCGGCHGDRGQGIRGGAPAVVGRDALPLDPPANARSRTTKFHTAYDVFDFVKENMPAKNPGTLTQDEYLAIVAFDLQENGVDLNSKPVLTPDALGTIVLHP